MKSLKGQVLTAQVKLAAEHAAKRGELSAKLTKPQANKVMQAIGVGLGFSRVPYAFAVTELRSVWEKEYTASLKRKQPVTQSVKPSVAKPKARTRKAPKVQEAKPEATAKPESTDSERMDRIEDALTKLAEVVATLATK